MIKPDYYMDGGMDVIDYAVMKFGAESAKAFCRINVIKYLTRFDQKNGIEDLEKAHTYIVRLIEIERDKPIKKYARNYITPIEGVRTHNNGLKEYKCAYKCNCGNEGVRYIDINADRTACHKCKCELDVYPATINDAHDEDFNYFVAYSKDAVEIEN